MYDFNARQYVASFPRFTRMDPLCEQYPWLSPYSYCGGDPINLSDPTGRDIFVLHDTGLIGHLGMLIQHEDNQWYYYSINGNNVMVSGSFSGGREFNDIERGSWNSPEEFMQSPYNSKGGEDGKSDKSVDYFEYEEGYLIESTAEQDAVMRESFKEIATTDYKLFKNNCATTVQRVMLKAGLPINAPCQPTSYTPSLRPLQIENTADGIKVNYNINITPNHSFKAIMNANKQGRYIRKK